MKHSLRRLMFLALLVFLIGAVMPPRASYSTALGSSLTPVAPPCTVAAVPGCTCGSIGAGSERVTAENAGSVRELARWGDGRPDAIVQEPNGAKALVASSLGVHVFDLTERSWRLVELPFAVVGLAIAPNGQQIALARANGGIELRSLDLETLVHTLPGEPATAAELAFSADGSLLASSGGNPGRSSRAGQSPVRLWRVADGALVSTIEVPEVSGLAFSPRGDWLAISLLVAGVRLVKLGAVEEWRSLGPMTKQAGKVAVSPDGRLVAASLRQPGVVRLWNVQTGEVIRDLVADQDVVSDLHFSPQGDALAASGRAGTLRVWRVADGAPLQTIQQRPWLRSAGYTMDGSAITTQSTATGTVRRWRVADGALLTELQQDELVLATALARVPLGRCSPDGRAVALLEPDGRVEVRELPSGTIRWQSRIIPWPAREFGLPYVASEGFSPDGRFLLAQGEKALTLFSAADGAVLRELELSAGVDGVAFAPGGDWLAVTSARGLFRLNLEAPYKRQMVPGPVELSGSLAGPVAISPDGVLVAYSGARYRLQDPSDIIHVVRIADGSLVRSLRGHRFGTFALTFSPDSAVLASGGSDESEPGQADGGFIRLWRVADGAELAMLRAHARTPSHLVYSPDGRVLVSRSWTDSAVRLWSGDGARAIGVLDGHRDWVTALEIGPGWEYLVTRSLDGTARLWSVP